MKHIIFDYDWTLFDTGYLINQSNIKPQPGDSFTLKFAETINWDRIDNSRLHYPDTDTTLRTLKDQGVQLYLFTEGDIEGQKFKISQTTIHKFIPTDHIHIFQIGKVDHLHTLIDHIPETDTVYYVEDKPSYLKDAKQRFPDLITVLIKQGPWHDFEVENFSPDITINTLSELLKHL